MDSSISKLEISGLFFFVIVVLCYFAILKKVPAMLEVSNVSIRLMVSSWWHCLRELSLESVAYMAEVSHMKLCLLLGLEDCSHFWFWPELSATGS